MKRFLMLLAVAAVAGAMYVAAAPGGQQSTPTATQFAALKKQVAVLSKSLAALKKDEKKVRTEAQGAAGFITTCFKSVVPVSEFGDPNGTFGFGYAAAPGATPGATNSYRTGIDVDASATPQGFVQAVESTCISSNGSASAAHASRGSLHARAERAH